MLILALALVVSACGGEPESSTYACGYKLKVIGSKSITIEDFARETNPQGVNPNGWLDQVRRLNSLYTTSAVIKPGKILIVPRKCEKGEKKGAISKG